GWQPMVLTARPSAFPTVSDDREADSHPGVVVARAFALDSARHLAVGGRYVSWTAVPDQWITWLVSAIPTGLRLIRRHRPAVLWSTYPIATAHVIGLALHRLTGFPWVADFRDPMTEVDIETNRRWPADPKIWRARCWIERSALREASACVFVSPSS